MVPLNPGYGVGLAIGSALPGYMLGFDEAGLLKWRRGVPDPGSGESHTMEQGGMPNASNDDQFQRVVNGTGATRNFLVGNNGHMQNAGELTTGTTGTGRAAIVLDSTGLSAVCLDTTSGAITYDAIFRIPTNSTGAQTFECRLGLFDSVTSAAPTDGVYITADANANANFQLITVSNGVSTTTSTGVSITAGTVYALKIAITNASSVTAYIVTAGSAWGSGTTVSSNIPSGTGRETTAGAAIIKSAGTTARTLEIGHQRIRQSLATAATRGTDAYALGGVPVSCVGEATATTRAGVFARGGDTSDAHVMSGEFIPEPITFILCDTTHNLVMLENAGSSVSVVGEAKEPGITQFSTTSGNCARYAFASGGTTAMQFDSASGTFVYEGRFRIDTALPDGTNSYSIRIGFADSYTTIVDGAYIYYSQADATAHAITVQNSTSTDTDTNLTINLSTWYLVRIVVTNDSTVDFYLTPEGTAFGAAVASHSTNIPSGSSRVFTEGVCFNRSAGSTSRAMVSESTRVYRMAA